MPPKSRQAQAGFSLIELAIVLTVIGLLVGVSLKSLMAYSGRETRQLTHDRLDAIQEALSLYAARNKRLPCPSDNSLDEANASYGLLYRTSKAAVNMVAKLAHADFSPVGARVISLHPGWARTDMGGPNADVEVPVSIAGMRRVIGDGKAYPSGGFFDYRGQPIAW